MNLYQRIGSRQSSSNKFDRFEHYKLNTGPVDEYKDSPEIEATVKNIGWTLGNDCPYRCTHCYSMNARQKGQNMSVEMIDRIVDQLACVGVETVNLGGNEPIFTNGIKLSDTLLPHIIEKLTASNIEVGITTSGISIIKLYENYRYAFDMLNDVDVSLDSPFEDEHNSNRAANIYHQALEALEICKKHETPHSIIMCGMNWNFSIDHIDKLHEIAVRLDANIRINPIKPIEPTHMAIALPPDMYYRGFARLMELCDPVDLGEPPIASVTEYEGARRCPCGRTSFRIHSITPDGEVYVSPCVYLHDYKAPYDLLKTDLLEIINSPQFRVFRQRNRAPEKISGCAGCDQLARCGGGCAARSYLHHLHENGGQKTMLARDPYCPKEFQEFEHTFPKDPKLVDDQKLVHMDYLCTWIGRPKALRQGD